MLGSYFTFVLLLVIGLAVCGVLAFAGFFKTDEIIEKGKTALYLVLRAKAWDQADNNTKTWIYDNFHCCGFVKPDNSTLCEKARIQNPNITGCRNALVLCPNAFKALTRFRKAG